MIVKEIAKGIALGRQEGLELAARLIEQELPLLAARIRQIAS
jgi:hypothetical protein